MCYRIYPWWHLPQPYGLFDTNVISIPIDLFGPLDGTTDKVWETNTKPKQDSGRVFSLPRTLYQISREKNDGEDSITTQILFLCPLQFLLPISSLAHGLLA